MYLLGFIFLAVLYVMAQVCEAVIGHANLLHISTYVLFAAIAVTLWIAFLILKWIVD